MTELYNSAVGAVAGAKESYMKGFYVYERVLCI